MDIYGYIKWIYRNAPCLYTATEWGAMTCVCGLAFQCGSTMNGQNTIVQAVTIIM